MGAWQYFKESLKSNEVALISLFVAIFALFYTTTRDERYDKNRTVRQASFEVLKNLGELQAVVNASFYQKDKGDPMLGWGHVALISDLSRLVPQPVPKTIDRLVETWNKDWKSLNSDEASVERISKEIDASRQTVLGNLRKIN